MSGRTVKKHGGSTVVIRGAQDSFEVVSEVQECCLEKKKNVV